MKTALITGANRGIGLAIAAALNKSGDMKVLVGSRRAEDGDNAARTLGGNAVGVQLDLSIAKDLQPQIKKIADMHGAIDILVNNAGVLENGNLLEVDSGKLSHSLAEAFEAQTQYRGLIGASVNMDHGQQSTE